MALFCLFSFIHKIIIFLLPVIQRITRNINEYANSLAAKWQPPTEIPPILHDFTTCRKLNTLLESIQNHILGSPKTLESYSFISQLFNQRLEESHRVPAPEISPNSIKLYFQSSWPSFIPLEKTGLSSDSESSDDSDPLVQWGWVRKSNTANEILLNADLVRALESALENSLNFTYVKTLLVVTIFHELSHTLTKQLFHGRVTPPGCGMDGCGNGESGNLLEDHLFGGRVVALWRFGGVGKMDLISNLLFMHDGMTSFLTPDHCRLVINSLLTGSLRPFIPPCSPTESYVAQPGDKRCRLSHLQGDRPIGSQVPIYGVKSVIGLGIQGVWVTENGVRRPANITDRF